MVGLKVASELMKVALAIMPKLLRKPVAKVLNGTCAAISTPLRDAPEPFTVVVKVQIG